jgi:uncharacterized protein (TIGR03118 family)
MNSSQRLHCAAIAAACGLVLAACGGGGGGSSTGTPSTTSAPTLSNSALTSNGAVSAVHADANLQNAWGLAFAPGGPFWVADNNDSLSTLYDGNGVPQSLVVSLPDGTNGPANPSGEVYNATSDFVITTGGHSTPALFIFDGEGGTLVGWSSGTSGVILYDDGAVNGANAAVYKGLALANNGVANYLYATDLHNARIDVFDASFDKVSANGGVFAGKFTDPGIPAGFAPFGITLLDGQLYVTYAMQNAAANDEVLGAGLGYVDIYDLNGNLVRRFASGGVLNAPWGIALAPGGFGAVGGDLLIGNFGDGRINAFHPTSGASLGALTLAGGGAVVIPGLWALLSGNGAQNAPSDALFYTAGPNDQTGGVFGRIVASESSGMPTSGSGY